MDALGAGDPGAHPALCRPGGSSEFEYLPTIIPGLLQTADYAAALVDAGPTPPLHRDRIVEFRQARQQRLLAVDEPLWLEVVIEEDALDRPVGGSEVLRSELDHLLAIGERKNITVQVMPRTVAVHVGVPGPFTLLDFAVTQSIGYIEYAGGAVYVPGYHEVAGYLYRKGCLQADALSESESREVIAARRAVLE